jgi:hypothetical protein
MSYRAGAVAVLALTVALVTAGAAAGKKGSTYQTGFDRWRSAENGFAGWTLDHAARAGDGTVVLSGGVAGTDQAGAYNGRNFYNGGSYVVGEVTSPLISTGAVPLNEGIASWNAATPEGTWIEVQVRGQIGTRLTKWFNLGVWASDSSTIERHSVTGQRDADGSAIVDTLVLDGKAGPGNAYQLKVRLFSENGATPTLRNVSFAYSTVPGKVPSTSTDDSAVPNQVLAVPECSQEIYPDGGEVWCSPTSTSMVLGFWGDPRTCEDREHEVVDGVFDWIYDGHGNWPFNTAHAATRSFGGVGMEGYVARFTSMRQLETWIAAGVPVVISYAWKKGDIDGVSVASSNGHLAVVVGFDANGDPVVNDPAEPAGNEAVQRTYPRAQLETQWLETSGGTAYLMYPVGHPQGTLPG